MLPADTRRQIEPRTLSSINDEGHIPQPRFQWMIDQQADQEERAFASVHRTVLNQNQINRECSRSIATSDAETPCIFESIARGVQPGLDRCPNRASEESFGSSLAGDPLTLTLQGECGCLRCTCIGIKSSPRLGPERCASKCIDYMDRKFCSHYKDSSHYHCRVPGCGQHCNGETDSWDRVFYDHERQHFRQGGKYGCNLPDCTASFTRFQDLVRHTGNRHCKNVKRYPCPEIGCKYKGDKGFPRKDKLQSHHKNVHEGRPRPVQRGAPRHIRPAVDIPSSSYIDNPSIKDQTQETVARETKKAHRM